MRLTGNGLELVFVDGLIRISGKWDREFRIDELDDIGFAELSVCLIEMDLHRPNWTEMALDLLWEAESCDKHEK